MSLKDHKSHATIAAIDLARARAFYEEKLGFTPASVAPAGAFYRSAGGTRFFLYQSKTAGTNQATYAGWTVTDIEAEVRALKVRGVSFETYDMPAFDKASSIATFGALRSAWFRDSEGNILGMVQLPPEVAGAIDA